MAEEKSDPFPNARAVFDDPDDSPKAQIFACIGMSKRGKSHFTEWLIRFMFAHPDPRRRWRFGLVFAGSLYSHAYDWLPEESRIEGYDEKRLEVHLERLKAHSRAGKKLPQSFVWFDDLMGVLPLESKVFMQLITTGRPLA